MCFVFFQRSVFSAKQKDTITIFWLLWGAPIKCMYCTLGKLSKSLSIFIATFSLEQASHCIALKKKVKKRALASTQFLHWRQKPDFNVGGFWVKGCSRNTPWWQVQFNTSDRRVLGIYNLSYFEMFMLRDKPQWIVKDSYLIKCSQTPTVFYCSSEFICLTKYLSEAELLLPHTPTSPASDTKVSKTLRFPDICRQLPVHAGQ